MVALFGVNLVTSDNHVILDSCIISVLGVISSFDANCAIIRVILHYHLHSLFTFLLRVEDTKTNISYIWVG